MNNKYELKLKLIIIESVITYSAFGFCMPIMTVFWNSIGMNQTLIGLSQMMCSIAILVFNIPMGYIADRFNRKKMNIIGDFGIVITFVIYMLAKRFIVVILAETLCGIFVAMTNGVDNSFVKFYCYKIDKTGADPDGTVDKVFDLFTELTDNEDLIDFPYVYANGLAGFAKINLDDDSNTIEPL